MIRAVTRCFVLILGFAGPPCLTFAQSTQWEEHQVIVENDGWELVGDLVIPASDHPVPAVLMFNQAAGDRTPYQRLAEELAERGIASLRIDLRGHGESTNQGAFVPGEFRRDPLIWDSEVDVTAVHQYIRDLESIDGERIGLIGGSYSGEEAAEAGRLSGYGQAYVMLSPGSFSEESIVAIDQSGVPWLFIVSNNERYLKEITADVQVQSRTVELLILPGTEHATDLLGAHPTLAERIAVWMAGRLME